MISIVCPLLAIRILVGVFSYQKGRVAGLVGPAFLLAGKGALLIPRVPPVRAFLRVDWVRAPLLRLTLWFLPLLLLACPAEEERRPELQALTLLVLIRLLVGAFSTTSLMLFYVFFEGALVPTTLLVLVWGYQPERVQASFYLVLYTVGARLPLLVCLLSLSQANGHVSFLVPSWH